MEVERKYGASATILFPLIDFGATDFESTPVTFASGDTQIIKDEGATANATNNTTHEGNGIYSLALTATEMQAARIVVTIRDQSGPKAWEDQAVVIATYGHASAQHVADRAVALPANFALLAIDANGRTDVSKIEGVDATDQVRDAILTDATRFPGANVNAAIASRAAPGDAMTLADGAITAAKIAAAALTATKFASGAIDAVALADDAGNEIADRMRARTLTEGYAADGAAPTLEQLLFMLWSTLAQFAIAGTTISTKRLDGTTEAMAFALDDDTDPTSRTRTS
jgi:hypothetical protein